jgi:hypothetical protein
LFGAKLKLLDNEHTGISLSFFANKVSFFLQKNPASHQNMVSTIPMTGS